MKVAYHFPSLFKSFILRSIEPYDILINRFFPNLWQRSFADFVSKKYQSQGYVNYF